MKNKGIKKLAFDWYEARKGIIDSNDVDVEVMQKLLKETYCLFSQYHKEENVPKEMCGLFVAIKSMLECIAQLYIVDEFTTNSDAACFNAISIILDEIEYGFLNGAYEIAFPKLKVDDYKSKTHILDMEEDFLEMFVEANR